MEFLNQYLVGFNSFTFNSLMVKIHLNYLFLHSFYLMDLIILFIGLFDKDLSPVKTDQIFEKIISQLII